MMVLYMDFFEFEETYMGRFRSYAPVNFSADKTFSQEHFVRVSINLISNDGDQRTVFVRCTRSQFMWIVKYAKDSGEIWKQRLTEIADGLLDQTNKFE